MVSPDYPELKHNPFVEPEDHFFGGGERQAQINQLRHLAQWSRRLLVVTGPRGMGKTTMFKALAASLEPRVKAARINGALVGNAREVIVEMAQGFGIVTPESANTQLLTQLVSDHVREQADRFCLVLIDDAHQIEPRGIEAVLALIDAQDEAPLHMVLFAEAQIMTVLERCAKNRDLIWHQMPLNALDNPDIRKYLQFRFAEAGHEGRLPFSERQIQAICQRSGGNLRKVNELANRELINLERGDSGFPSLHRAIVLTLAVALVLVYVVWDALNDEAPSIPVEHVAAEGTIPVGQAPGRADIVAPEPPETTTHEPPAALEPTVAPEVDTPPADVLAEQTQAPPAAALPVVDKQTPPAIEPVDEEGVRNESWILHQDAEHYTIQLLATASRVNLDVYLNRQGSKSRFAVFEAETNGRPLYFVIYGIYSDRVGAEAGARVLPASVGKVDPWIRTIGGIQNSIRKRVDRPH